jgi:hypothetical protein
MRAIKNMDFAGQKMCSCYLLHIVWLRVDSNKHNTDIPFIMGTLHVKHKNKCKSHTGYGTTNLWTFYVIDRERGGISYKPVLNLNVTDFQNHYKCVVVLFIRHFISVLSSDVFPGE